MTEVTAVDLQTQLDELRQKLESFSKEHHEFRAVHISRRGVEGGRGERGEQGPVGPPADLNQVAAIAAELVKKAFKHQDEVAKFERLFKELQDQIDSAFTISKAALQFAVITELKEAGVIDAKGHAILGPTGAPGKDSTIPGPQGAAGPAGRDGRNGVGKDGADGSVGPVGPRGEKGESGVSNIPGPKGERGEQGPEGLPGLAAEGVSREEVVEIILDMKRRGTFRS